MNYSLRVLQAAYMVVTLRNEESNGDQCSTCWTSRCDCNSSDIKTDSFLNLTTIEEFQNA